MAREHWEELSTPLALTTTTYVFDETMTFFNKRGHHERAVQVGERLLRSPSIHLIHVDENLFQKGFDYFKAHHDKRYSLTDCVSFVVIAGFTKEP